MVTTILSGAARDVTVLGEKRLQFRPAYRGTARKIARDRVAGIGVAGDVVVEAVDKGLGAACVAAAA